ncbi:MAG: hypothetical protein JXA44_06325 [Methanospirillaceae archaeon]|nr:hypothetical protein [Methanospirillaceae archaeon]
MTAKPLSLDLSSLIRIILFLMTLAGLFLLLVKGIIRIFSPNLPQEGESDIIDAEWRIKE